MPKHSAASVKRSTTRKQLWHPDAVREKIQAVQLISLLQRHAMGKKDLSMSQIRAAEICLRKSVPDLSSQEVKSQVDATVHITIAR